MTSLMRRAIVLACATILTVAPLSTGLAAEGDSLTIRHVSVDRFPKVEIVVSSGSEIDTSQMDLQEGGEPAANVKVEPLNESGQLVDIVLVIDSSGSMEGKAMSAALTAARGFVDELPSNARVGIVQFADVAGKISSLRADREDTIAALNGVTALGETALFDGVVLAARMFRGDAQRNIVLLSDGGDTASSSSQKAAIASAKAADATIFSVGLETTETDTDALKTLSASTQGRYQPAETADLSNVYGDIATELASQFAVTFTSSEGSGEQLAIGITAPSGQDTVTVLTPKAIDLERDADVAPRAEVSEPPPLWLLIAALGLCFLAAFVLAISAIGSTRRKQRESRLRGALYEAAGRSGVAKPDDDEESSGSWLPDVVISAGGRVASRVGMREALDKQLERAAVALKPDEFVGLSLAMAAGGYLIGALFSGVLLGLVLTLGAGAAPTVWLQRKTATRLSKISDQIPDILTVLAGSLRAGHSFLQAIEMAASEVDEPGASEFQRVVAEIRLGRSITDALEAMADRVNNEGFTWAAMAVNIQREVGGNLAELLDTVAETLRTRAALKRQVKALSAEGRLSMYVLAALPVILTAYMAVVNRSYLDLLFTEPLGRVMIGTGACLLVAGFLWMRKVVDIDV